MEKKECEEMKYLILSLILMNCVVGPNNTEDLGLNTLDKGTNPNVKMDHNWTLSDKYLVSHTSSITKSWSRNDFRFYDSTEVIITAKPEGSLRSTELTENRHFFIVNKSINIVQVDFIESGLKLHVTLTNKKHLP